MSYIHRWIDRKAPWTLLLLHGTGGDENDLLTLAEAVAPGWNVLSPRGNVLEHGVVPRFFARKAEGVFDMDDLAARTAEMAAFVEGSAAAYGFDRGRVAALGYSNVANLAASLLLTHPGGLAGAALLRPMVDQRQTAPVAGSLDGVPVLIAAGAHDRMIPRAGTSLLSRYLDEAGAEVTTHAHSGGHELAQGDIAAASAFFGEDHFRGRRR